MKQGFALLDHESTWLRYACWKAFAWSSASFFSLEYWNTESKGKDAGSFVEQKQRNRKEARPSVLVGIVKQVQQLTLGSLGLLCALKEVSRE